MRSLHLQIHPTFCHAELLVDGGVLKAADIKFVHGPVPWMLLLSHVGRELHLDQHTPPGLPCVGENPDRLPWLPVLCGKPHAPGYGWGFLLPLPAGSTARVSTETCCGFASAAAARQAAAALQEHAGVIPQMPGATFEVFPFQANWAFADMHGEIHTGFSNRRHAQGCATKTENEQWRARAHYSPASPPDVVISEPSPPLES